MTAAASTSFLNRRRSAALIGAGSTAAAPRRVVGRSTEFQRVTALPRRVAHPDVTGLLTEWLRVDMSIDPPLGVPKILKPVQTWAIWEAITYGGILGNIGVGGGKCVCADTEIFDGASRRTVLEMVGEVFPVATKTADHKIAYGAATAFESGRKECVRLELADGTEVKLSSDHPVFTPNGWVHAGQLSKGMLVGTPRSIPAPLSTTAISDDEVVLAAYLLSDGGVSQQTTSFTNITPEVVEEFCHVTGRLADNGKNPGKHWKNRNGAVLKNGSDKDYHVRGLLWFRRKWGINGLAKRKRLPASFWGLSVEQVALFLNRFWACDGYMEDNGFGITLASEKMIDDIRFLLLRLGIHSTKHFKTAKCDGKAFQAWRVAISGQAAVLFAQRVGPVLGKEAAFAKTLAKLLSTKRNTNYDVVPIGRPEGRGIADELGLPRHAVRECLALTDGQLLGREKFAEFTTTLGYKGQFAWLAHADLTWEKVEAVTLIGMHAVYDLSVPETGCFVGNGVVLHNTLVSYVLPFAMEAQRPILLVPGNLKKKTDTDFKSFAGHWRSHPNLRVITYQTLSRVGAEKLLETVVPDLIIADEAHFLKNTGAGCTRRVKRWMAAHPTTRFINMSGTLTRRSIMDYSHLSQWALKDGSPLPQSLQDLLDLADSVDEGIPDEERPDPGALWTWCQPGETPRQGFRRRLLETPGVVASESPLVKKEDGTDVALNIIERIPLHIPPIIGEALDLLRSSQQTPSGDELTCATEIAARARELALGFYYRWNWPNVTDPALRAVMGHTGLCQRGCNKDHVWLDARKAWRKFVRTVIKNSQHSGRPLDTEQHVALAVINGQVIDLDGTYKTWVSVRDRWDTEKLKQAVWVSDFIVKDVERWVRSCQKVGRKGIVWAESLALLKLLHESMPDVPFYPSGDNRIVEAGADPNAKTCIAAMSHGTGKNLQTFNCNLTVEVSTSGNDWEQRLGRTHRSGQEADEVTDEVYLHSIEMWEAFEQARRDAAYVEETWKQVQRLSYATIAVSPVSEVISRARTKDPLWFKPA